MKTLPIILLSGLALLCTSFTACQTATGTGALAGGVIGAAISNDIRGAAIGAGVGALAGAVVDENQARQARYQGYRYEYAEPHRRGYVRSPYRPYAIVDVRGIRHGARVIDPTTDRIFINP